MPAGDIAIKNVSDLYLYPNTVRAVLITGAQVKDWLEMSAGMFNQVKAGSKDAPLLNPDFPSYNYDVIDGVTYEIDLSQPAMFDKDGEKVSDGAGRIVNLQFDGKPIDPAAEVRGRHQQLPRGRRWQLPRDRSRQDHLRRARHQPRRDRSLYRRQGHDQPVGRWQLALQGAARTPRRPLKPARRARQFAGDVKGAKIEDAGDGENGFAKYRLVL